ncbi:hypothetical protein [Amycolatopsis sp. H20-H5]|uniref:hypothetical protein n=1 Tax=Amycolatopsis sp. H20-H5 TaxID=3046309 RepID=UPI002DB8523D|nr:hypothetical protein [Amycolatopsis sp. H20-H5]MEC3976563.1 hypothetical protein [Amycolatopsis sp. H20-H5]
MGMAHTARRPSVHSRLREAKRFSWTGFLVTVAGSLLGALVPGAIGAGSNATRVTILVMATLTAGGLAATDGSARGVKAIAIVLLAAGALALTVSGVTLLDLVRGASVSGDRTTTFPVVPEADEPPADAAVPDIRIPDNVACGKVPVDSSASCKVTVTSSVSRPCTRTSRARYRSSR